MPPLYSSPPSLIPLSCLFMSFTSSSFPCLFSSCLSSILMFYHLFYSAPCAVFVPSSFYSVFLLLPFAANSSSMQATVLIFLYPAILLFFFVLMSLQPFIYFLPLPLLAFPLLFFFSPLFFTLITLLHASVSYLSLRLVITNPLD